MFTINIFSVGGAKKFDGLSIKNKKQETMRERALNFVRHALIVDYNPSAYRATEAETP